MKRTKKLKVVMGVLFALSSSKAFSQGYIEGGFIPNRDFLDDEKKTYSSFCRMESSLTTDIHWCSQQFKRFRDISTFEIVQ